MREGRVTQLRYVVWKASTSLLRENGSAQKEDECNTQVGKAKSGKPESQRAELRKG